MQKHREKMQAIAAGTYRMPLVEEAKDALKQMEKPNLTSVLGLDKFRGHLTDEEIQQLKTFMSNYKHKIATSNAGACSSADRLHTTNELVKRIGNTNSSELHRQLLTAHTEKERSAMILERI
jgi:hypothetical protein